MPQEDEFLWDEDPMVKENRKRKRKRN
jgi:hypothetical protein